jgi:hypothetical protein
MKEGQLPSSNYACERYVFIIAHKVGFKVQGQVVQLFLKVSLVGNQHDGQTFCCMDASVLWAAVITPQYILMSY